MEIVIFDGVAYGMLLFLIAVGLSITMGMMNFVNLAHGSFAMGGAYTASVLMSRYGLGFFPSLAAAFVTAALVGALLELAQSSPTFSARRCSRFSCHRCLTGGFRSVALKSVVTGSS
jgi:branched-subunit amino acid ABC-type transport system permease component